MAALIIYICHQQNDVNPIIFIIPLGILHIIIGSYFQTLKTNYFIGIKTPWTLENENVWKTTHKTAGKLWFVGGIIVLLSALIFNTKISAVLFLAITIVLIIVPFAQSYFLFQKEKSKS